MELGASTTNVAAFLAAALLDDIGMADLPEEEVQAEYDAQYGQRRCG